MLTQDLKREVANAMEENKMLYFGIYVGIIPCLYRILPYSVGICYNRLIYRGYNVYWLWIVKLFIKTLNYV